MRAGKSDGGLWWIERSIGIRFAFEEHRRIVAALKKLEQAANREGKQEIEVFAKKLVLHARMEEEVLYPAAILVGEFVRARLESGENARSDDAGHEGTDAVSDSRSGGADQ